MKQNAFYLFLILITACTAVSPPGEEPVAETVAVLQPEPTLLYGIPIDSMGVYQSRVKWGHTLATILKDYGITNEALYEIGIRSKKVYDVRKIKARSDYTIIYKNDSTRDVSQFIFEPDNRSYVIYHFGDSVYAELVNREVEIVERSVVAEVNKINDSVAKALSQMGAPNQLANKLVDMFAWQVSFFHIYPGDFIKIIYEEEQVGGEPIGIKRILASEFNHGSKKYYGIHYESEKGKGDYFDEDGNSLRKVFLKAPLDYKRISSRFSPRRYHPVLKRYKAHLGTDYAANPGTPIRTVGDGVVVEARYHQYNGNYVKIRHNSNYTTQYLHMQKIKTGIRPGVTVRQGQTIGFVGSTGLANGPHLCFRFWKNGRQVDAMSVDLPPSEPIKASELSPYLHEKNVMLHKLNLLSLDKPKVLMAKVGAQP